MEELLFKIMDLNIYDVIIVFCVVMFLLIWILDKKITHALIFVGVVVVAVVFISPFVIRLWGDLGTTVHHTPNFKKSDCAKNYFKYESDATFADSFLFSYSSFHYFREMEKKRKIPENYVKHIENKIKENPSLCDAYAPPKIPKIKKERIKK